MAYTSGSVVEIAGSVMIYIFILTTTYFVLHTISFQVLSLVAKESSFMITVAHTFNFFHQESVFFHLLFFVLLPFFFLLFSSSSMFFRSSSLSGFGLVESVDCDLECWSNK